MKVMRGFAVIDSIFQQATFKGIPLPSNFKEKTQLVVEKIFLVIWIELWI